MNVSSCSIMNFQIMTFVQGSSTPKLTHFELHLLKPPMEAAPVAFDLRMALSNSKLDRRCRLSALV